jgi:hypothetical protein
MVSKPFKIDTRSFEKKGDAHEFFKAMLNRYTIGERVSASDKNDLLALLKLHTEYKRKLGAGVAHFEVMDGGFGTQCFKIIRIDGTSDDFSYKHCITPKKD